MTEKINAMHPDLVIIAGDIYDNEYDAIENPEEIKALLASIESRYGVFACWGNHDLDEEIFAGFTFDSDEKKTADDRMARLLKDANIHLLSDETMLIDDSFYIAGRNDPSRARKTESERASADALLSGLDKTKPILSLTISQKSLMYLRSQVQTWTFPVTPMTGRCFRPTLLQILCGIIPVVFGQRITSPPL